jgi:hypothetical protein
MEQSSFSAPSYVIKAEELHTLNYMAAGYPRPQGLEWIDCSKDVTLRASTIQMLVRTLYRLNCSPSVQRLHQSAGLRVKFQSLDDRLAFAALFQQAALACTSRPEPMKPRTSDRPCAFRSRR